MDKLKALSLLEPWASLVVLGEKQWETRSWRTSHSGLIYIHASQGMSQVQRDIAERPLFKTGLQGREFVHGAIIGHVRLVEVRRTEDVTNPLIHPNPISEKEIAFGDYSPGRYCFRLEEPTLLDEPIPCKGSLNVWDCTAIINKKGEHDG